MSGARATTPTTAGAPALRGFRRAPWLVGTAWLGAAGCFWIPGFPPDKVLDNPGDPNRDIVSHCTPHEGQGRPVLLSRDLGPRTFGCRFRPDVEPEWTLDFESGTPISMTLGQGVERVVIDRGALPWSPEPYGALLRMRVPGDGREVTYSWRLVVVPHPADLFEDVP